MTPSGRFQPGFSMLELVIGLFIFGVGMLALASLQGQLIRSQADASVRSVATNIAEEQIEFLHGFGLIDNNPDNQIPAYTDIVDRTFSVSRGNVDYVVAVQVVDYYYDILTDRFVTTNPENLAVSDFKDATINVSWGETPGFRISDSQAVSATDLGTGSIELTSVISSVTTQGAAAHRHRKKMKRVYRMLHTHRVQTRISFRCSWVKPASRSRPHLFRVYTEPMRRLKPVLM